MFISKESHTTVQDRKRQYTVTDIELIFHGLLQQVTN